MRFARKSLSFVVAALISVGLISPVAEAQAERIGAPKEQDTYVQEFFQKDDIAPAVNGFGGLTDVESEASQRPEPFNDEIIADQDVWVRITGDEEGVSSNDSSAFSLLQQGEIRDCNWNSRFHACENYRITLDHCVGQRPSCQIVGSRTLIFRSDFSMSGADRRVRVQPYVRIISETGAPLPEGITYEFVNGTSQPLAQANTVFTEELYGGNPSGAGPTFLYPLNQQSLAIPLVPIGEAGTRVNLRISTTLDPNSLLRIGDATIRCSRAWLNSTANCVNPFVDPTLTFIRTRYPYIAENISSAIASGQPSRLTRITGDDRDQNRVEACGAAAQRRLEQEQPKPVNMTNPSCDEYPFASAAEGGAGAQTMWVPLSENSQQGRDMQVFLRNNQVQVNDAYRVQVF